MRNQFELRPFSRDEYELAIQVVEQAFLLGGRQEDRNVFAARFEFPRSLGAYLGDRVVGTAGAYTFELSVPGTTAPAAGVTIVTVHPTHRRRGILSAMMDHQLADLHEGGEPIAVLRASEASIYRRFGYAVATRELVLEVDRAAAGLAKSIPGADALELRLHEPGEVLGQLAEVYDAVRPDRPGFIGRKDGDWADELHDPDHRRHGATALRAVLAVDGADPRGYVLYRVRQDWTDGLPTGRVYVAELVAADPTAEAALWQHELNVDLATTTEAGTRPLDEPLLRRLANPRQARARVFDGLWLRLVRLGDALAARCYAAPVDLVLEVLDTRCPWNTGRWRLAGDETGATCDRTATPADLRIDITALAGAYLGDPVLTGYAAAGLIDEGQPAALRRLATALGWTPEPWCPHHF